MTINDQPKVTEATVLGENCGACRWWEIYPAEYATCDNEKLHGPPIWDYYEHTLTRTEHPPGRSVCPEFEAMK